MDSDEKEIHDYLKGFGRQFVSAREICRRAGGKRKWAKNPYWAMPVLTAMVDKNILETDEMAHYRIKPDEKEERKKRWLSPEIAKILKEKGLNDDAPPVVNIEPSDVDDHSTP